MNGSHFQYHKLYAYLSYAISYGINFMSTSFLTRKNLVRPRKTCREVCVKKISYYYKYFNRIILD